MVRVFPGRESGSLAFGETEKETDEIHFPWLSVG